MIFVDTGAWFASIVPWDSNHLAAVEFLARNREPLVTSDYVVDETLTLLRVRREPLRAEQFGLDLFGGSLAQLIYVTPSDIDEAWSVFQAYRDKQWSFTDCASKVLIERLGLTSAFSFDQHFRQFGTVQVVP